MQILYQVDLVGGELDEAKGLFWGIRAFDQDVQEFANMLAGGVSSRKREIDALLEKYSANWKLSRMATIDKNILRIAVFELLYCNDIPVKVTINEAVEIAKSFGTEESGAFVNGILDNLAKKYAKDKE